MIGSISRILSSKCLLNEIAPAVQFLLASITIESRSELVVHADVEQAIAIAGTWHFNTRSTVVIDLADGSVQIGALGQCVGITGCDLSSVRVCPAAVILTDIRCEKPALAKRYRNT